MKKAVVLLSGGIDSSTTAYIARDDIGKKGELYPLTLYYGQRHFRELESAATIAQSLGATHKLIELPIGQIVSTALTGQKEVPTEGLKPAIPVTWVPQRNAIFLALAFAYAETLDADTIYTGVNVMDYSGYPDCRPEFIEAIGRALNLASKRYVETGRGFGIITPIIKKTKADIIRWGLALGVPFEKTWSCYNPVVYYGSGSRACGVCDSCRIRLKAWDEVGVKDPIAYDKEVE